jgi:hypothetical protein
MTGSMVDFDQCVCGGFVVPIEVTLICVASI